MMGPGEALIAFIVIGLPVLLLMLVAFRYFRYREKKLDVEAGLAAEKAAQYAARTHELEERLRVIEQIVTDRGLETASQIEALRDRKRIASSEDIR
jgi:ABC-type phosphate transport system auxiliary subunit